MVVDPDVFDSRPKIRPRKKNTLPLNPESIDMHGATSLGRFPSWLHRPIPKGNNLFKTGSLLKEYGLNTVCEEAKCPNRLECYSKKTATFLVLGSACTRSCGFCEIDFSKNPPPPSPDEPMRVAKSVEKLGLKHVVITMVARDDLPDGGANHLAKIMKVVKEISPDVTIEILTSDFSGNHQSVDTVLSENPEIFNHNIETVRSLTPRVRHKAQYDRTLDILKYAKTSKKAKFIKSGLMVGLGESVEMVEETITDLYEAGCDMITIGQYLQASRLKLPVRSFVHPDQFKHFEEFGKKIGIAQVYSGPFVRSSYHAAELKDQAISNE